MAPIRKAKGYFIYWTALLISGVFSWLGRPGPTWAEDAKQQYNAKVFQETYRVAQTTTGVRYVANNPTNRNTAYTPSQENPYLKKADVGFQINPSVQREIVEQPIHSSIDYFQNPEVANQEITQAIDAINQKIDNKENLSTLERAFIYSLQINKDFVNQAQLFNLKNQPGQ